MKQMNLAGLIGESLVVTDEQDGILGALGAKRRALLKEKYAKLTARLGVDRSHPESKHLIAADNVRDNGFSEVSRTVQGALKSTIAARQAAGAQLDTLVRPLKGLNEMPYLDQSIQLDLLRSRYEANPANAEAAATLGLTEVIAKLWEANEAVKSLYAQRLDSIAADTAPAPTQVKAEVVHAYNDFCDVVTQTLDAMPTPELQALFTKLNELRKKYASRQGEAEPSPAPSEGGEGADT